MVFDLTEFFNDSELQKLKDSGINVAAFPCPSTAKILDCVDCRANASETRGCSDCALCPIRQCFSDGPTKCGEIVFKSFVPAYIKFLSDKLVDVSTRYREILTDKLKSVTVDDFRAILKAAKFGIAEEAVNLMEATKQLGLVLYKYNPAGGYKEK